MITKNEITISSKAIIDKKKITVSKYASTSKDKRAPKATAKRGKTKLIKTVNKLDLFLLFKSLYKAIMLSKKTK